MSCIIANPISEDHFLTTISEDHFLTKKKVFRKFGVYIITGKN